MLGVVPLGMPATSRPFGAALWVAKLGRNAAALRGTAGGAAGTEHVAQLKALGLEQLLDLAADGGCFAGLGPGDFSFDLGQCDLEVGEAHLVNVHALSSINASVTII